MLQLFVPHIAVQILIFLRSLRICTAKEMSNWIYCKKHPLDKGNPQSPPRASCKRRDISTHPLSRSPLPRRTHTHTDPMSCSTLRTLLYTCHSSLRAVSAAASPLQFDDHVVDKHSVEQSSRPNGPRGGLGRECAGLRWIVRFLCCFAPGTGLVCTGRGVTQAHCDK